MAAQELLRRTEAAQGLIAFTEYTFPRYRTAPHHRIIAEQLERVERGEIDRLMLLVPPRHGKSELASKRLPAWYLGRQPHKQFLSVSSTESLAADFGREVRNIIGSPEYKAIFNTKLAEDSQAKGKWHTSAGGFYYALGIGGSVLGRGGDVILIDDPYSSMQDALSELTRKNVWDWYTGTAYNRLMPGGAIVVINHRMHEDDLCGQLLQQQAAGGDQWEVVKLPAITEDGGALWPDAYPIDALDRIKRNSQARFWSALYLQNPTPDSGDYFKAEWLRPYTTAPDAQTLSVYGASDYAVTSDGGDYTVHVVIGLDSDNRIYLLDLWRGQAASDKWIAEWCRLVKQWKPLDWAEETGQISAGLGPFIEQEASRRAAYVNREQFPTRGDKAVRAQSIRGRMSIDGLYVPTHADWYADFRAELLSFPAGRHDDQCVAVGTLVRMAGGTERPIECISVDDFVDTPLGPQRVIAAKQTNPAALVYKVSLSDGSYLIATGNHPVYIENKGFVRVDALSIMDECRKAHPKAKLSNTVGTDTGGILTVATEHINGTFTRPSRAEVFCTDTFGRTSAVLFLLALISITSMAIRPIIQSIISNVYLRSSIVGVIRWLEKVWPDKQSILRAFEIRPLGGMHLVPVLNGTSVTANSLGKVEKRLANYAFAAANKWRRRLSARNSVREHAASVIAIEALTQPMAVHNLTVMHANAYYANGILTHNCDALGLVGQLLDRMVAGRKPVKPEKPANMTGYRSMEVVSDSFKEY